MAFHKGRRFEECHLWLPNRFLGPLPPPRFDRDESVAVELENIYNLAAATAESKGRQVKMQRSHRLVMAVLERHASCNA